MKKTIARAENNPHLLAYPNSRTLSLATSLPSSTFQDRSSDFDGHTNAIMALMFCEPHVFRESDVINTCVVEGEIESREDDRDDEVQFGPGKTR